MKNREFQHPSLPPFARRAEAFCSILEKRSGATPADQARLIHVALAELYPAALALPKTDVLFDPDNDDDSGTTDSEQPDPDRAVNPELPHALAPLSEMLGQRCFYREIFDPFDANQAEVVGNLADDIQDVYRDLRSGLLKWNRGEAGAALWEWRFSFECHWGEHATSALRALYALCAWYDGGWPSAT